MSNASSASDAGGADIEPLIRRIWSRSLSVADVKPDDDFIKLGGDSLRAMQVITLVREELGVEVPLVKLLDTSNLREFCLCVERTLQDHLSSLSEDDLLSLAEGDDQPDRPPDL
jgi:acyl carrier protein